VVHFDQIVAASFYPNRRIRFAFGVQESHAFTAYNNLRLF
jgi:hypothetical protein